MVSFLTELRGKLLSNYLEEKLSAFLLLVKSRKKKTEPSKYHSSAPTDQADHRLSVLQDLTRGVSQQDSNLGA